MITVEVRFRRRSDNEFKKYAYVLSVRRKIPQGEIVAVKLPDGKVTFGKVTRMNYSYNKCSSCIMYSSEYVNPSGCPCGRKGLPLCYSFGENKRQGRTWYSLVRVDIDNILENL